MLLFFLAYLGGVLTILSPCILPVLPFVFARSDQPFVRSGLPMLAGMALTFAAVATLAAVGGGWAVQANQFGRIAALILLAFFGVTLLIPQLAEYATRPLVGLGNRLAGAPGPANAAQGGGSATARTASSFLLGIGTGLLWAPCAGPILGLVLTGAALEGATVGTSLLLLAYGAGAATSLAVALLIGGRVFGAMKRSLGAGEWIRRGFGVAVLAGVAAIALGLDNGLLTRISLAGSGRLEQSLTDSIVPQPPAQKSGNPPAAAGDVDDEGRLPPLTGATEWLNSPPLTAEALKGKVVLIDFWTYSCINCLRTLPYLRAWADKYKDKGLVVIGVHAPEFAFEKDPANVRKAVRDLDITYPVALDNDFTIWRMFDNQYWPAHYFIDAKGVIRHHHFGEGDYEHSEAVIRQLLKEAGRTDLNSGFVQAAGGAEMQPDPADDVSPETYVGYARGARFSSPQTAHDAADDFTVPAALEQSHWGLAGNWTIRDENATLNAAGGVIAYRFHARDLHLVLGPGADGRPVRFKVTLDGRAPGPDHGVDTDADGMGTVTGQRLYQLVRQTGAIRDRTFEIEFLDPGVQAFAFTFG